MCEPGRSWMLRPRSRTKKTRGMGWKEGGDVDPADRRFENEVARKGAACAMGSDQGGAARKLSGRKGGRGEDRGREINAGTFDNQQKEENTLQGMLGRFSRFQRRRPGTVPTSPFRLPKPSRGRDLIGRDRDRRMMRTTRYRSDKMDRVM